MPDRDNEAVVGVLSQDIESVLTSIDKLKTTFDKDYKYISAQTLAFVASLQKQFNTLDDAALEHARKQIEASKQMTDDRALKAQMNQAKSLAKAFQELSKEAESLEATEKIINQIHRIFLRINKEMAEEFRNTAQQTVRVTAETEKAAKARKKLKDETQGAVEAQNKLNAVQREEPSKPKTQETKKAKKKTPDVPVTQAPKTNQIKDQKEIQKTAVQTQRELNAAATAAEDLGQKATEALGSTSPAPVTNTIEKVKEAASEAKQEVISFGNAIGSLEKRDLKAREIAAFDDSIMASIQSSSMTGARTTELAKKIRPGDLSSTESYVKEMLNWEREMSSFFANLNNVFTNSDSETQANSILKMYSKYQGLDPSSQKSFDSLFKNQNAQILSTFSTLYARGIDDPEITKAFESEVQKFIDNANKLKSSVEGMVNDFHRQNAEFFSKQNKAEKERSSKTPALNTDAKEETKSINSGISHQEKILAIRKEIASTGTMTEAQTASEMKYMEYLAKYMKSLQEKGNTAALDEIKTKFKEIETAGIKLPELLKALVTTPNGADAFLSILEKTKKKVQELNAETGSNIVRPGKQGKRKAPAELKPETSAEMASKNANAAIDYMRGLKDILKEMSEADYGSTEWIRLKNEAKDYEGYIKGVYDTITERVPDCEAKMLALARVEEERRNILSSLTDSEKQYALVLGNIANQEADLSILSEKRAAEEKEREDSLVKARLQYAELIVQRKTLAKQYKEAEEAGDDALANHLAAQSEELEKQIQLVRERGLAIKEGSSESEKSSRQIKKEADEREREFKSYSKFAEQTKESRDLIKEKLGGITSNAVADRYADVEVTLKRVIDLQEKIAKADTASPEYDLLTKELEEASANLRAAHENLLNTKANKFDKYKAVGAVGGEAVKAYNNLLGQGIQADSSIYSLSMRSISALKNAPDNIFGTVKKDLVELRNGLVDAFARPNKKIASTAAEIEKTAEAASEAKREIHAETKAVQDNSTAVQESTAKANANATSKKKAASASKSLRTELAEEAKAQKEVSDTVQQAADTSEKEPARRKSSGGKKKTTTRKSTSVSTGSGSSRGSGRSGGPGGTPPDLPDESEISKAKSALASYYMEASKQYKNYISYTARMRKASDVGDTNEAILWKRRAEEAKKAYEKAFEDLKVRDVSVDLDKQEAKDSVEQVRKALQDQWAEQKVEIDLKAEFDTETKDAQLADDNEQKELRDYLSLLKERTRLTKEYYGYLARAAISRRHDPTSEDTEVYTNLAESSKRRLDDNNKLIALMEEENEQLKEQALAKARIADAQDAELLGKRKLAKEEVDRANTVEAALASIKKQIQLEQQYYDLKKKQAHAEDIEKDSYDGNLVTLRQMADAQEEVRRKISEQVPELAQSEEYNRQLIRLSTLRQTSEKEILKILDKQKNEGNELQVIYNQFLRSITNRVVDFGLDLARDALRKMWDDTITYAHEYNDLLNEIRIVTGQTQDEADAMGKTYRRMAKEMSVSSTEIASAAVEFWRQGLDDSEVNSRQVNTTQYAKISGLEFQEAAELVTAATNSMDLDARRVVDVFAYLGKQHCP